MNLKVHFSEHTVSSAQAVTWNPPAPGGIQPLHCGKGGSYPFGFREARNAVYQSYTGFTGFAGVGEQVVKGKNYYFFVNLRGGKCAVLKVYVGVPVNSKLINPCIVKKKCPRSMSICR